MKNFYKLSVVSVLSSLSIVIGAQTLDEPINNIPGEQGICEKTKPRLSYVVQPVPAIPTEQDRDDIKKVKTYQENLAKKDRFNFPQVEPVFEKTVLNQSMDK